MSCKCPGFIAGPRCEISEQTVFKNARQTNEILKKLRVLSEKKTSEYRVHKSLLNLLDALTSVKEGVNQTAHIKLIFEIIDDAISTIITPKRDQDNLTEIALKVTARTIEISNLYLRNASEETRATLIKEGMRKLDFLAKSWIDGAMNLNTILDLEIGIASFFVAFFDRKNLTNFTNEYQKIINVNHEKKRSVIHFNDAFFDALLESSNSSAFYIFITEWGTSPFETFTEKSNLIVSHTLNISLFDRGFQPMNINLNGSFDLEIAKKLDLIFEGKNDVLTCRLSVDSGFKNSKIITYSEETDSHLICKSDHLGNIYLEIKLVSENDLDEVFFLMII